MNTVNELTRWLNALDVVIDISDEEVRRNPPQNFDGWNTMLVIHRANRYKVKRALADVQALQAENERLQDVITGLVGMMTGKRD